MSATPWYNHPKLSAQHRAQDDAFHEIQLNGKQLVFLFMAATVVSVVIFLCGVLVGRGVRVERGGAAIESAANAPGPAPDAVAAPAAAAPAPGSDPTKASTPPPDQNDEYTYYNRLDNKGPAPEELKTDRPAQKATTGAVAAKEPAKDPAPRPVPPAANATEGGYALQVAALRERPEAEAIAKRLSSKGYSAYVLSPANGTPSVYRVRVGQFKTRHEAETAAARLQKEEQFKPWITR